MSQNRVPTSEKQKPVPMEEPLKKHADKGGAEKEDGSNPIGGAGEPQTTPPEPEKQGGIGGPYLGPILMKYRGDKVSNAIAGCWRRTSRP